MPDDLDLVEAFLNTLDERTFTTNGVTHTPSDALDSVEGLHDFFTSNGLCSNRKRVRQSDLTAARALRSALRDAAMSSEDTAAMAALLERFPLRLTPDGAAGLRMSSSSGIEGLDPLVETVAVSVATGRWSRMKLCASTECRWAFHDVSRSGAGRWCTMNTCGNREKTRAYRRRQIN